MPSEKITSESESRSSREGREVTEVRERRQAPAQLDRASQREGCRLPARPDRTPHDEAPPACLSGDPTCAPTERILEPEVRRHHRRKRKLLEFTHSSTRATMLMLAAAVAALVIENTPVLPYFAEFWHTFDIGISLGDFAPRLSLEHFINDFLMAIFFLLVGLEIKFEMTAGELKNPRKALLPILGAAGGAIVPALVYTAVNVGSGFEQGWGVPMANDIAFCLGILALLGSRIPAGLRSFLSTLTIADDIIAIMVIAVFYTANLDVTWLAGGLGLFAVLIVFNRLHIYDLLPYIVVGLGMWVCFLMSGVHATIAGVLLALAIPARSQVKLDRAPGWFAARARRADDRYDPGEPDIVQKEYLSEVAEIGRVSRLSIPPITRLDHRLHIPVYFFILPLFAFSNASVVLTGMAPAVHRHEPGDHRRVLRPAVRQAAGHLFCHVAHGEAEAVRPAAGRELGPYRRRVGSGRRGLHHGHLRDEPRVRRPEHDRHGESGYPGGIADRRYRGILHPARRDRRGR